MNASDNGAVRWKADPVHLTADELLAKEARAAAGLRESCRDEAAEWLRERLNSGPVPSTEILNEVKEAGFGEKKLQKAIREDGSKPTSQRHPHAAIQQTLIIHLIGKLRRESTRSLLPPDRRLYFISPPNNKKAPQK